MRIKVIFAAVIMFFLCIGFTGCDLERIQEEQKNPSPVLASPTITPERATPTPVVTVTPRITPVVTVTPAPGTASPTPSNFLIIVDHNAVEAFDAIPDSYIAQVKTMLLNIPGASHGRAFVYGLELLEARDSRYAVNATWTGEPEGPTNAHLRIVRTYRNRSNTGWAESCGEESFWTNAEAVNMMKNHLNFMRVSQNNPVHAFSYAWSYEVADGDPTGGWAGKIYTTLGSYDDYVSPWDLSSTEINMDDYLNTVEEYLVFDPGTAAFFATTPADGNAGSADEKGYQRYLKNEYIRNYVKNRGSGVLFDYEDIVAYNDRGEEYLLTWNGHIFPATHPDNNPDHLGTGEYDGGEGSCHIGTAGTIRLAKGLWYMMARVAGWDG